MGGRIQVAIRTRPTATFAEDCIKVHDDKASVTVKLPKNKAHGSDNQQDSWTYRYDAVLHNASQETVYKERVTPLVRSVLEGYNGTVMCYGQTGAGKTFTSIGSAQTVYAYRGIAPRAIAEVFQYVSDHPQFDASIGVSYLEIYNDALVDLLGSLPSEEPQAEGLQLIEEASGSTHVKGLRVEKVADEEAALNLLFEGESNRAVANHQLNRNSTRGHAIFTIYVQIRSRVESSDKVVRSKLHLVDLAGSERLKKTETAGELRSESMYINRSLTYLEQVVVALGQRGRSHTPYRQSKLTHLLKDALGGNCKTLLLANIYGEAAHIEETLSTLQFAARVRAVTNEPSINEHQDAALLLKRCTAEIANLKRELAMHDALSNRSRVSYEPYTEAQRSELMNSLVSFVEHKSDEVPIESVRQMQELLLCTRELFSKKQAELDEASRNAAAGRAAGAGAGGVSAGDAAPAMEDEAASGVGEIAEGARGLSIGKAPDGARPPAGLFEPAGSRVGSSALAATVGDLGSPTGSGMGGEGDAPPGRQEAFDQFKAGEGYDANARLLEAKASLKTARGRRAELASQVNAAKAQIDALKARLDGKKAERLARSMSEEDADIIDEEEYALIQELKAAKGAYKAKHEGMREASSAVQGHADAADGHRQELLSHFDEWYLCSYASGATGVSACGLSAPTNAAPDDVMDDDEQFEQLQIARVMAEEPESLAFVRARKAAFGRGGRKGARK